MSDVLIIAFVLALIIAPCIAVVGIGLWLSRGASRVSPGSVFVRKLTPTGILLFASLTLCLLGCAAIRVLAPQSTIGALLSNPTHALLALLVLWALFTIGYVVASRLGHPISNAQDKSKI